VVAQPPKATAQTIIIKLTTRVFFIVSHLLSFG